MGQQECVEGEWGESSLGHGGAILLTVRKRSFVFGGGQDTTRRGLKVLATQNGISYEST